MSALLTSKNALPVLPINTNYSNTARILSIAILNKKTKQKKTTPDACILFFVFFKKLLLLILLF